MIRTRYLARYAAVLAIGMAVPALVASRAAEAQATGPNVYLDASMVIVAAIDRYEMGTVWELASPVMKSSVPQDRFIATIAQRRALLGTIRNREWMSVMRVPVTDASGGLPPGQYVSVRFATTGNNAKVMEEVVSFRRDDDGQWRLVGYTLS